MEFGTVFVVCWLSGLLFLTWVIRRHAEDARSKGPKLGPPPPMSAEEILKQRYVRGEISAEQYAGHLEVLHAPPRRLSHPESPRRIEGPRSR